MASTPTYIYVAGIGNAGPTHWQRIWHERAEDGVWVGHEDWDNPDSDTWTKDLQATLSSLDGEKIIVAHSLGCLIVAEWAQDNLDSDIIGAFLVAVPDTDGPSFPAEATGFGSRALTGLPFASNVVASENDPYGTLAHAATAAALLGAVAAWATRGTSTPIRIWPNGPKADGCWTIAFVGGPAMVSADAARGSPRPMDERAP